MKNYWLNLMVMAGIFWGCGDQVPNGILPENQMQAVLSELHLADAIADTRKKHLLQRRIFRDDLYDEVLQKHGLTRETFMKSYQYYLEHPTQLDSIYQRITADFDHKMEKSYDDEYGLGNKDPNKSGKPDITEPKK